MGASRNRKCSCGSGKKEKNCCNGRLPTSQTVTVDFGEKTKINGVRVNQNGEIELFTDGVSRIPVRAWVGAHRDRKNGGEKKLFQIPISPNSLQLGETNSLEKFDRIFAIDTNMKNISSAEKVYACCFAEAQFIEKTEGKYLEFLVLGAFLYWNGPSSRFENFSWRIFIESLMNSPDFEADARYALITDSDLGNHTAYNERETAYFDANYLPQQFTLLFGTDKGRHFANQLIKVCDQEAGKLLRSIEEKTINIQHGLEISGGWCDRFARLTNNHAYAQHSTLFKITGVPHNAFRKC